VFAFEIGAVFEKWGCVVLGLNDPIGVRLKKSSELLVFLDLICVEKFGVLR